MTSPSLIWCMAAHAEMGAACGRCGAALGHITLQTGSEHACVAISPRGSAMCRMQLARWFAPYGDFPALDLAFSVCLCGTIGLRWHDLDPDLVPS